MLRVSVSLARQRNEPTSGLFPSHQTHSMQKEITMALLIGLHFVAERSAGKTVFCPVSRRRCRDSQRLPSFSRQGRFSRRRTDENVSLIVPVSGTRDQFVISQGRKLVRMTWDGLSLKPTHLEVLVEADEPSKLEFNFNDGKADQTGRLWAGIIPLGPASLGSLYSLAKDSSLVWHATDIGISNGLAWSADGQTMYYIDSMEYRVDAFDCDMSKPLLANRRSVFDLRAHGIEGLADGMTIDMDGNLWVAVFRGAQVLNIDSRSGKLLRTVTVPVLQPTSVAFGGTNLDELYVTTANYKMREDEKKANPDAGATFKITGLGVKGFAGVSVVM